MPSINLINLRQITSIYGVGSFSFEIGARKIRPGQRNRTRKGVDTGPGLYNVKKSVSHTQTRHDNSCNASEEQIGNTFGHTSVHHCATSTLISTGLCMVRFSPFWCWWCCQRPNARVFVLLLFFLYFHVCCYCFCCFWYCCWNASTR